MARAATPVPPLSSATAAASPRAPGARNVMLTVTLRYEMQCGYPGPGPFVVTLPAAMRLPGTLADGSVLVGERPAAARVVGHRVEITPPKHSGVLCHVLGPGVVKLRFTPAAHLRNPRAPGSYRLTITHGTRTFGAALRVGGA